MQTYNDGGGAGANVHCASFTTHGVLISTPLTISKKAEENCV
jgi:hypothetical protein